MTKINLSLSDKEFERQINKMRLQEKVQRRAKPSGKSVRYDASTNIIILELTNGLILNIPVHLGQEIHQLSPLELMKVTLNTMGDAIRWPEIGVGLEIENIMAGRFGSKKWMEKLNAERGVSLGLWPDSPEVKTDWGKIGGSMRSQAKTKAAQQNGKKGGRPKKQSTENTSKTVEPQLQVQ